MNTRARFNATMHYQPRDRAPIADFGFWKETIPIWHAQGLPKEVFFSYDWSNTVDFFGMDFGIDSVGIDVESGLYPEFEEKVLEDHGNRILLQQSDGVIVERDRFMSSIPRPVSHLLTDRESWRKHFVPRLNPETPERFPRDWEERVACWKDPGRDDRILALPGGSLYGWLRNWMGLEKLSLTVYDDPAFFDEMITTVADCIVGVLEKIFASGVQFDACGMWEDMAYNAGPLLHPKHFRKYMMPHYRRITDLCRRHGVDVIWVDCDGKMDLLLPLWLEAGVNCMFPLEVGTWHADPIHFRRQYGRDLLMMGGFDKHILAQSTGAIEREVLRLAPLVEEGGFIGFCDHRVPPDVPYQNYLFYLEKIREIWGKGLNLKPFLRLQKDIQGDNQTMNEKLQTIHDAIVEGNLAATKTAVQSAVEAGIPGEEILRTGLIPAMSKVGCMFEEGEYFVPEMLIAARAMKGGLEIIKPLLVSAGNKPIGKVAVGTVKGDLHDIGKNLVAMMLEGAGFEIVDLGTDVDPEKYVEAARSGVNIIGLSALLTTTMQNMDTTIQAIQAAGLRDQVKIMVGGAPVTAAFAEQIGADGFAPDASQAANLAKTLIGA